MKFTERQRTYFGDIARAAFANPFSEEREHADAVLAPGVHARERIDHIAAQLQRELATLDKEGRLELRQCAAPIRSEMRTVFLFDVFHRYIPALDALIESQLHAGDEPAPTPFAPDLLRELVTRGFPPAEAEHNLAVFFQIRRAFYFISRGLPGATPSMRRFRERLWQNVFTRDMQAYASVLFERMEDFSTLLLGETGTGKGAAAAAIGRSGFIPFDARNGRFRESFTRAFLAVNLSQFPESLIESELFGHRKGAFTGAMDHYPGLFAHCSPCGAVFLDEIGDVPVPIQIKLLQVLQERRFAPVGSHDFQRFSGRVIAATHQPIDTLRVSGRFRHDFYYRLCSDVIEVPTLRQRLSENAGELNLLLDQIVRRVIGAVDAGLADAVRNSIATQPGLHYAWPGNVRELEQAVRQILITGHYSAHAASAPSVGAAPAWAAGEPTAAQLMARYCRSLHDRYGTIEEVARRTRLDRRTAKKYIAAALAEEDANA